MGALATQYSAQAALQVGNSKAYAGNVNADLKVAFFSYVHTAGAGTVPLAYLVKLPPGNIRILSDLSRFVCSDMTTNVDGHIGYDAHNKQDGTPVVADDNAFLDDSDFGGSGLDAVWTLPAAGYLDLDSRDGVWITLTMDQADNANGDTVHGYVAFMALD